jgi:ABC-type dipeptide/oligopeptide/nickel transport system permease subunit
LLEEREHKLESVLSVASSLLAKRAVASSTSSSSSSLSEDADGVTDRNSVELKRFLLSDALDQQAKKSHYSGSGSDALGASSTSRRRYAALVSVLLVSAAVGIAAVCALDLGEIAVSTSLF